MLDTASYLLLTISQHQHWQMSSVLPGCIIVTDCCWHGYVNWKIFPIKVTTICQSSGRIWESYVLYKHTQRRYVESRQNEEYWGVIDNFTSLILDTDMVIITRISAFYIIYFSNIHVIESLIAKLLQNFPVNLFAANQNLLNKILYH